MLKKNFTIIKKIEKGVKTEIHFYITMRFAFAFTLLITSPPSGLSLVARIQNRRDQNSIRSGRLYSDVAGAVAEQEVEIQVDDSLPLAIQASPSSGVFPLTGEQFNARLSAQLEKLAQKDRLSLQLSKEDVEIIYEDKHIAIVDKPAGVLTVPGKVNNPSLNQAVFDAIGCEMDRMDMMVVHRLGMDSSGLIVFSRTMDALRGMNTAFRTRQIERKYEALLCGHLEKDYGVINLPLMRDYECPPFQRISTDDHQRALLDLDPEVVDRKILEGPKDSITKYEVIAREELDGEPVTRVTLTSMSGRYHQLNVHMAAFGHPIVGDTVYGVDGDAAANGGLTREELESLIPNRRRASAELQRKVGKAFEGKYNGSCTHAKYLKFRHPVTKEDIELFSDAPF